jgi:hypothetical protein
VRLGTPDAGEGPLFEWLDLGWVRDQWIVASR